MKGARRRPVEGMAERLPKVSCTSSSQECLRTDHSPEPGYQSAVFAGQSSREDLEEQLQVRNARAELVSQLSWRSRNPEQASRLD